MIYESIESMLSSEAVSELPVIIPSYNNPSYLKMMVSQLINYNLKNIIIIDNNSTINGMRELLEDMGSSYTVVSKKTNDGPREFYENKDFYNWLPNWFIVTDPDIGFNQNLPDNFVEIMKDVSERFKSFKVAFALDINMSEDSIVNYPPPKGSGLQVS
jgi:hypothetical protein